MAFLEQAERAVNGKIVPLIANTGVFGGASTTFVAWLGGQNAVAWIGALIGIAGLVLNWWHKRAMQRIERGRLALERERFDFERAEK